MKTAVTINGDIARFGELVNKGLECWTEAGEIVARNIDADPEWVDKAAAAIGMGEEVVYAFDRIGRKKLHPRLLISDCPGYSALRNMPIAIQEKHIKEPVELLINSDGSWEPLLVDAKNLTAWQAKQVFSKDGIRTLPAQRAWVEDKAMKRLNPPVAEDSPYRIVKRTLVVSQPCQLSAADLARMLAQMES